MRGSSVKGVAIVESHNRWITIHGTQYLVVRDCVGYRSVGHGFFMEDGTETNNLLDRNLAVQACTGKALPKQVLPFVNVMKLIKWQRPTARFLITAFSFQLYF